MVIGAIIGVFASVGTMALERIINRVGKFRIFYKRSFAREANSKPWGVYRNEMGEKEIMIPMSVEFQNTSYSPKIIRDFAVYAYINDCQIAEFRQIYRSRTIHKRGNEIIGIDKFKYGEEESYSFVVKPTSIAHYSFEFILHFQTACVNINNLRIGFYDERNKFHLYKMCSFEDAWVEKKCTPDEDWIMLT